MDKAPETIFGVTTRTFPFTFARKLIRNIEEKEKRREERKEKRQYIQYLQDLQNKRNKERNIKEDNNQTYKSKTFNIDIQFQSDSSEEQNEAPIMSWFKKKDKDKDLMNFLDHNQCRICDKDIRKTKNDNGCTCDELSFTSESTDYNCQPHIQPQIQYVNMVTEEGNPSTKVTEENSSTNPFNPGSNPLPSERQEVVQQGEDVTNESQIDFSYSPDTDLIPPGWTTNDFDVNNHIGKSIPSSIPSTTTPTESTPSQLYPSLTKEGNITPSSKEQQQITSSTHFISTQPTTSSSTTTQMVSILPTIPMDEQQISEKVDELNFKAQLKQLEQQKVQAYQESVQVHKINNELQQKLKASQETVTNQREQLEIIKRTYKPYVEHMKESKLDSEQRVSQKIKDEETKKKLIAELQEVYKRHKEEENKRKELQKQLYDIQQNDQWIQSQKEDRQHRLTEQLEKEPPQIRDKLCPDETSNLSAYYIHQDIHALLQESEYKEEEIKQLQNHIKQMEEAHRQEKECFDQYVQTIQESLGIEGFDTKGQPITKTKKDTSKQTNDPETTSFTAKQKQTLPRYDPTLSESDNNESTCENQESSDDQECYKQKPSTPIKRPIKTIEMSELSSSEEESNEGKRMGTPLPHSKNLLQHKKKQLPKEDISHLDLSTLQGAYYVLKEELEETRKNLTDARDSYSESLSEIKLNEGELAKY